MKTCAIFTNTNDNQISRIYKAISKDYDDICVFTENPDLIVDKELAVLYSFYMGFYNGTILFTNLDDYIEHYETTKGKKKLLICEVSEITHKGLDKSYFKNTNFIKISSNDEKVEII